MIRHLAAVAVLYGAALCRWVRLWDLTDGIGRWRRLGKCQAPDPYWTHHRSGF